MRNRNLLLTVTAVMSFLGISSFAKDADGRLWGTERNVY